MQAHIHYRSMILIPAKEGRAELTCNAATIPVRPIYVLGFVCHGKTSDGICSCFIRPSTASFSRSSNGCKHSSQQCLCQTKITKRASNGDGNNVLYVFSRRFVVELTNTHQRF